MHVENIISLLANDPVIPIDNVTTQMDVEEWLTDTSESENASTDTSDLGNSSTSIDYISWLNITFCVYTTDGMCYKYD